MTRRNAIEGGAAASLAALAASCARKDMKEASDLADLDAVETAARIKSGELKASEAVEAAIARAEKLDPKINAIAFKTFGHARDHVKTASGPWGGVPTFIKDLDDVIGEPTAFGSRAFPGYRGKAQTPLIDKVLSLGVVSLGKSTTPEFGLTATTEPLSTGKTRNPWNTDYSTGGSSGGAAALVAARVVPIAHASDGGGSIRIPASCCGNVGLKVSYNRNPLGRPDAVQPISLSVHGVQSRTVRDTAAFLAAIEAPPEESGLPEVGLVTGPNTRRLRIALYTKSPQGRTVDDEVVAGARRAADICRGLGHEVTEVDPDYAPGLEDAFLLYWAAIAQSIITAWEGITHLKRNGLVFENFTLGLVKHFEANRDKFDESVKLLLGAKDDFKAQFETADVLMSPVLAAPTVKLGYLGTKLPYEEHLARVTQYAQFTSLYNIVGAPAISLPLAQSKNGMPMGVMFGARAGDERTLLELAYELEEAQPWIGKRPALIA
ncbi:MAG: amidase [Parvularculaceae bacterium]